MKGLLYDCPLCIDPLSHAGQYSGQPTVVGYWGNAKYTNLNDWLNVDVGFTSQAPMTWNEETRTCSNVINKFSLDFLIGSVGSVYNIQKKISYASANYGTAEDWTWANGLNENCTDNFDVMFTASFTQMNQAANEGQTPDPPPLAPTFPSDIFYPFLSSTTPAGATGASIAVAVLIIAIGLCLPIIR